MSASTELEGWFGKTDKVVYDAQVKRARDDAKFVEIGCWKGRSSCHMASAIRNSGKQIELFCVDTWMGSTEHVNELCVQSDTLYEEFLSNTQSFKDIIQPVRLPSVEASQQFEDGSCDFIFIDAAHDYDNVLADIDAWLPKLKANGVLAGHDYCATYPGVIQAVEKKFGGKATLYGTSWIHSEPSLCLPSGSPSEILRLLRFKVKHFLLRRQFAQYLPHRSAA